MEEAEEANTTMLPYILDILSRQQDLAMSVNDIQKTLQKFFKSSHGIKKQIKFALKVGHNMGLFSLTEDRVCVRFSYRYPTGIKKSTSQFIEKSKSTIGRNLKHKKGSDHHGYSVSSSDLMIYKSSSKQKSGRAKKNSKKNKGIKKQQSDESSD